MKSNKRYTSEDQILKKIDEEKARAEKLPAEADRMEDSAKLLQAVIESGDGSPETYKEMTRLRDEAIKARKLSRSILENKIPELGRKLAIFQTALLPHLGEDRSIPVR